MNTHAKLRLKFRNALRATFRIARDTARSWILLVLCLFTTSSCGQQAPNAKFTFNVTDGAGKAMPNVSITVYCFDRVIYGEGFGRTVNKEIEIATDHNGVAVFEGSSAKGNFGFGASAEGYYTSGGTALESTEAKNGKWQPWNKTIKVELKKVLNPVPMYARRVAHMLPDKMGNLDIPPGELPNGFDFEAGDWVAPYGKGKHSDMLFTLIGRAKELGKPYHAKLTVSFPKEQDGFIPVILPKHSGSALKLGYLAPEDGYQSSVQREHTLSKREDDGMRRTKDENPMMNFYFRTRTTVDKDGKIISANYGKIYGDFVWLPSGKGLSFNYYFNPTPNDRNVEFDVKRNHAKHPEGGGVHEP